MIIGLTGLPAAGKGTVAQHLISKYGAQSIRFSDPIRDIIKRVYQEPTRESMSHTATFLRSEFGNDIFIQTLLRDIEQKKGTIFVLDGMRYPEEFEALSKRDDFKMVGVTADFDLRYERIIRRGENDKEAELTREEFKKQHLLATETFIEQLVSKAHHVIDNNGDKQSLLKAVDAIMEKYGF